MLRTGVPVLSTLAGGGAQCLAVDPTVRGRGFAPASATGFAVM
jgi:hypothetical protein